MQIELVIDKIANRQWPVHLLVRTKLLDQDGKINHSGCYDDELNVDHANLNQWRKLGLAIKESSLIYSLQMQDWNYVVYESDRSRRKKTQRQRSLDAFFKGVKHNRSIKFFGIVLSDVIIPYLTTILRRGQIRFLDLKGKGNRAQALALSNCISQLERLDIHLCWIDDDVSAELIMSACTNLETMNIGIGSDHQASALCSMIQNGRIWALHVWPRDDFEVRMNKRMFEMRLAKAMCNNSSIQNIMASNHTLRDFFMLGRRETRWLVQLLEINEMGYRKSKEIGYDKSLKWIIHKKVFGFYFIGDFDTTPFENIVPSVMAKVLSDIDTGSGKMDLAAIFRLLKAFPCIMDG